MNSNILIKAVVFCLPLLSVSCTTKTVVYDAPAKPSYGSGYSSSSYKPAVKPTPAPTKRPSSLYVDERATLEPVMPKQGGESLDTTSLSGSN